MPAVGSRLRNRTGKRRRLGHRWRRWRHYTPVDEIVLSIAVVTVSVGAAIGTAIYLGVL